MHAVQFHRNLGWCGGICFRGATGCVVDHQWGLQVPGAEVEVMNETVVREPMSRQGEPTDAPPGSPRKIRVLMERASRREPLFHPKDNLKRRLPDRVIEDEELPPLEALEGIDDVDDAEELEELETIGIE